MPSKRQREESKQRSVRVDDADWPTGGFWAVRYVHLGILASACDRQKIRAELHPSWVGWEQLQKHRVGLLASLGLIACASAIAVTTLSSDESATPTFAVESTDTKAQQEQPTTSQIRVEISGAVASPTVVQLPEGARLIDAVEAVGGWGERVDPLRVEICLNLAAPLQDGSAVRIPSLDDRFLIGIKGIECGPIYAPASDVAAATSSTGGSSASAPIDLNSATAEQLDALPGIGPATAAKIIAARKNAPILVADDLLSRGVISARVLEQIRPLVTP